MFRPSKPDIKAMLGQDPGQNTVVIQCRHDRENMFARLNIKQRTDAEAGEPGNQLGPDYMMYHEPATLEEAASRIDNRDIVYCFGKRNISRSNALDNAIPVLATMAGAYVRTDGMRPDQVRNADEDFVNESIAEHVRVLGVSLGGTNPTAEDEGSRKEQITVRTQGTVELFNNSQYNFVPNDVVVWEIPTKADLQHFAKRYGWSTKKVPLKVAPLRHAQGNFSVRSHMDALLQRGENPPGMKNLPIRALARSLLRLMIYPMLATNNNMHVEITDETIDFYVDWVLADDFDDRVNDLQNMPQVNVDLIRNLRDLTDYLRTDRMFSKVLDDTMLKFFDMQEMIRRRTLGTSLQFCKPGQLFTVLLNQT